MNAARTASLLAGVALAALLAVAGCSPSPESSVSANGGTNTTELIEPNVAVGKVRVGMTAQQVVSALGEPARRSANALEYPALGLAVMPGPDGMIKVVMCGDVTGLNGPFVAAFIPRTKEGIGMKSTRAEVVKAYGEPEKSEKFRLGLESLTYPALGITFTLENDKVHHMIVRLGGAQEPEKTIAVEPAPAK
jgi:hypothetical protein